ncbi:hypothetical protein BAUCODRAFT_64065 [Baudoinia panamericana UAMH 10762]|uniref:Uncharacterized protein n=1 Tax=Baudoinia panamericana (strain UAMH 10762) TaxID=717646 RepID=M2N649_BAUPA|nr:uncharacterized protein BAUCODRAFT_64065 [Baudoinia panamericana UAMH 10762]EMC99508.1 hypothetical protein BAUCODRAFT_64065 [Baudoinia panamericana UAMH 10762]
MLFFSTLGLIVYSLRLVHADCFEPSPAFPLPLWQNGMQQLEAAFQRIDQRLEKLAEDQQYDTSSFSVGVTSNTDTLWTHFHSARVHNATRPGVTHIDGDSQYRIASISKTFTVLGILHQHAAGNLSLDEPVSLYIDELKHAHSGDMPWNDITIRVLASQLSGIPRDVIQADLINGETDPTELGLPPVSKEGLPRCYEYGGLKPCNRTDLLHALKTHHPIFAPNAISTYSNTAFELLGLVLENVIGLDYDVYMQHAIFGPLNMTLTSLSTPPDDHAVLPVDQTYWDVDQGVHKPTGGIYSSLDDMSKYLRYVMTHYNALATGVNWLLPASWSTGMESFYGMPWEIFRTDRILEKSKRPVTFVTKAGGVPSYFSRISIMPEYGLGLTVLIAGSNTLLKEIQEIVTVELVREAEAVIWKDVQKTYSGNYVSTNTSLNSSIELAARPSTGLVLQSFISNGTDVFQTLLQQYAEALDVKRWHAQLVPTLLYKNEAEQKGEIWRLLVVAERTGEGAVWDEFCNTDVDPISYAGLPVNEFVFWHEEQRLELPAWRVSMKRSTADTAERLVVQV